MAQSPFFQFALFFLPSQQRAIILTRKYVASHLFCCHGAILVWYFKAVLITFWQVGVNAVWMTSLQAHFPFPSPYPPPFFFSFPEFSRLFTGYILMPWACCLGLQPLVTSVSEQHSSGPSLPFSLDFSLCTREGLLNCRLTQWKQHYHCWPNCYFHFIK